MGHVGHVDRRLPLEDTAGIAWPRTLVALDHVHAGYDDAGFRRKHPENLALRPFVAPRENDDAIALPDLGGHQRTSGAREMIFMNFLPRSSRVTGPKMRVPIGSPCLLIRTAAFRSNRMAVPGRKSVV